MNSKESAQVRRLIDHFELMRIANPDGFIDDVESSTPTLIYESLFVVYIRSDPPTSIHCTMDVDGKVCSAHVLVEDEHGRPVHREALAYDSALLEAATFWFCELEPLILDGERLGADGSGIGALDVAEQRKPLAESPRVTPAAGTPGRPRPSPDEPIAVGQWCEDIREAEARIRRQQFSFALADSLDEQREDLGYLAGAMIRALGGDGPFEQRFAEEQEWMMELAPEARRACAETLVRAVTSALASDDPSLLSIPLQAWWETAMARAGARADSEEGDHSDTE